MKFDRIVLFVLGKGSGENKISSAALQNEIKNRISDTCDKGSAFGACYATFDGDVFDMPVISAINNVRADARLATYGIFADSVNCVFVINNSLTPEQWKRCIEETKKNVSSIATKSSFYAIYQRDGFMDNNLMSSVLAESEMAVYCFQQQTEFGNIIASETDEKQLMAYYALLAGVGALSSERGIYTGSFNKLSLMAEDFHRIRNYFIVNGLLDNENKDPISEDTLFGAFFGNWAGSNVTVGGATDLLRDAMRKKIKDYFPKAEELAVMANSDAARTRENISRFIEINFESPRFNTLMNRIVYGADNGKGRPGIVDNWSDYCEKMLNGNVAYYRFEVVEYVRKNLSYWVRQKANEIAKSATVVLSDPMLDSGKDFIAGAVRYAYEKMNRYMDLVCVKLLNAVADKLDEKASYIRECVKGAKAVFNKNQWLLDDAELTDFEHYARDIISQIASFCRSNNLPQSAMTYAEDYFGTGASVEANWKRLVSEQNSRIFNQIETAQTLVAALQNMNAADFVERVPKLLINRGDRLYLGTSQVMHDAGIPKTIYIVPTALNIGLNGKELPGYASGSYEKLEVKDFDNMLQFVVARLGTNTCDAARDSAEYRKAILEALPASMRYIHESRYFDNDDESSVKADASAKSEGTGAKTAGASVKCIGNKLAVQLPAGIVGTAKIEIEGFSSAGTRKPKEIKSMPVGSSLAFEIPLNGTFGQCSIKMTVNNEVIIDTEFEGPRSTASQYVRTRPVLFGKTKKVQLMGEDFTAECHIFKLAEKNEAPVEACVNLTGAPDAFLYPIGGGTKWEVWVGESVSQVMQLEACDKEGIRRLEETVK